MKRNASATFEDRAKEARDDAVRELGVVVAPAEEEEEGWGVDAAAAWFGESGDGGNGVGGSKGSSSSSLSSTLSAATFVVVVVVQSLSLVVALEVEVAYDKADNPRLILYIPPTPPGYGGGYSS